VRSRVALMVAGLISWPVLARPVAEPSPVVVLLDRYIAGDFDGVARDLEETDDLDDLLDDLKASVPAWLDAGGAADRPRRELAAATFALEAARAGALDDWKLVRRWMGLENIFWRAPAKLVEWGCQLLRDGTPEPRPIERTWHLASIALVAYVGDYEFLIGSAWEARANPKDEFEHLEHAAERFPYERRFALAQGIAVEWRLFPRTQSGASEARQIFESLQDDEQVGAEASVRLGLLRLRANAVAPALALFEEAERRTREPYVVYLARYFRGRALERARRPDDAIAAHRGALDVIPGAQSASFALAALLASRGHRTEAARVADQALTANPRRLDPWRAYGQADARFWPELIDQLHQEIVR
jgi:tetratricopeptide (TPR) repeat protein